MKRLDTLTNETFLGQTGVRTVFMIEIATGIDIVRYTVFEEAEVLLYPGTLLEVVASMDMGGGLFQVHLREVAVPAEAAMLR